MFQLIVYMCKIRTIKEQFCILFCPFISRVILLLFQATHFDHGTWTCMLTLDEDYESITTYINLQVGLIPLVSLSYPAEAMTTISTDISSILLVEGEEYNFTCTAERVFPRPELYWTVDNEYSEQIQTTQDQAVISMSQSSTSTPVIAPSPWPPPSC